MIRALMVVASMVLVTLAVVLGRPAPALPRPASGIEHMAWAPLPPPPPEPLDPGQVGHVMMTVSEAVLVESALGQRVPPRPSALPPVDRPAVALAATAPVTLSGIQFVDETTWTVWLNGLAVTPGMDTGLVTVVAVARDTVTLEVARGANPVARVDLMANQTFVPATGGVVTGLAR